MKVSRRASNSCTKYRSPTHAEVCVTRVTALQHKMEWGSSSLRCTRVSSLRAQRIALLNEARHSCALRTSRISQLCFLPSVLPFPDESRVAYLPTAIYSMSTNNGSAYRYVDPRVYISRSTR